MPAKAKKSSKAKNSDNTISPRTRAQQLEVTVSAQDVKSHLTFLKNVDDRGGSFYDEKFVRNALRRYEQFWIPFIQKFSSGYDEDLDFAPPFGKTEFHLKCIESNDILYCTQMSIGYGTFTCSPPSNTSQI